MELPGKDQMNAVRMEPKLSKMSYKEWEVIELPTVKERKITSFKFHGSHNNFNIDQFFEIQRTNLWVQKETSLEATA